jgi:protein-tyrosine phosphatase
MDRRQFFTAGAAAGAMSSLPGLALAASVLEGRVTRLDLNRLRLDWVGTKGPVLVMASSDPDAPALLMRPMKIGLGAKSAEFELPTSPRPYFLITSGSDQVRVAERLLPLQGGRNFRDLGGYRTTTGQQVRWGQIYRSGVMTSLTASDFAYLRRLGVSVICDFRSPQERAAEPSPFQASDAVRVLSQDYDMTSSMGRLLTAGSREAAVKIFADAYVDFTAMLAPQYTEMFASLVRNQTPLAINCTAGKDRTGMASALILSVLGVPRETVIADYALSQTFVPPSYYQTHGTGAAASASTGGQASAFGGLPKEVSDVIMGSDPDVMRLTLARLDREFGGPIGLARARLGLTDASIARLREIYLV